MIRLLANANYDFIGLRRWAYGLTALVVVPGLVLLLALGLNYSVEFTGGTLVQVNTAQPVGSGALRAALSRGGVGRVEIQSFGSDREFVVRARLSEAEGASPEAAQRAAAQVDSALARALGPGGFEVVRIEAVGPKVGGELRQKALGAILLSFVATLIYLAFRFEFRFGVAAVIATAHDILATLAFIVFMRLEVSLVVVGAILSIVGYSLNDTIVVFDRVRENLHKFKRDDVAMILNRSINETLPRTIMTGGTTLAAILALLVLGGAVIRPFAWVMAFGVVTGTFSSVFIAAPVLLIIERRWPGKEIRGVRARVSA